MPPVVRTVIFTLLVPGAITAVVPYLLLSRRLERFAFDIGLFRPLGVVPIALGVAVYAWCAWEFGVAGRGTPAIYDPPKVLVVRGLYRVVRNPIYIGIALILFGEAVVFQSLTLLVYAIVVWLACHWFVLYGEEPELLNKFGEAYEVYLKDVPRWIPRLSGIRRRRIR